MKDAYSKNIEEVLESVGSSKHGLSEKEANKRLEQYGQNVLKQKKKISLLQMILTQLTDRMIIILLIATILSFILGEIAEAVVILIIIIVNITISIFQEKKAQNAVLALKKMNIPYTSVFRDNKWNFISTANLVVGDIVRLEDGVIVPADIRIIEEHQLKVDESSLTGESVTEEKDANTVLNIETALADRTNMLYSSTIVTYGTATGVVVATGMDTEIGKIAKMLDDEDELDSPLKRKLNAVGEALSIVGITISIIIFIIGFFYGKDLTSLLMIAISLAISVIPEGLPATATIVMALGVQRMAKKNAWVKKLPVVEALGSSSVICTDKTGTLTQNKMTVVKTLVYDNLINNNTENKWDNDYIYASILCNNAYYEHDKIIGDPTEGALLEFAQKQGYNVNNIKEKLPKLFEQPFDSYRKRMTTVHQIDNNYIAYTKGAAEELIEICTKIKNNNKDEKFTAELKKQIKVACNKLASEGLRTLGLATKKLNNLPQNEENIENDLTFIGLITMIDPPRPEVYKAIQTCHEAGIRVIMITGDHKLTATAIAKDLGILQNNDIAISGDELNKMSDEQLAKDVNKICVFARVSPEDKLRIIKALKENEEIVAMTGDGVNDSPALKSADIGVAMGKGGTDVAKDAADMILLDDNFKTIESAIFEGRRVFRNIQKVIQFLLAGNIAEVLLVFIAMVANMNTPLLAVHILFINLVTDTLPALALGVDPASPNVMKQKPIKNGSLFEKGLITRIIFYGIYICIISLIAFIIGHDRSYTAGVTMAFSVICLAQIVHALNQHSNTISLFSKHSPRNKYLFGAMLISTVLLLIVLLVPTISNFFSLCPLTGTEWLIVLMLSISPLIVVEIFKFIHRNLKS